MFTLPLQVLDLILFNLIYSLTEASNFRIRNLKSAFRNCLCAHQTLDYRRLSNFIGFENLLYLGLVLSFALFVLFVVNPLLKSAFRNRLCAHERPVYRHCFSRQRTAIKWAPILQDLGSQLSEIIGFENLLFNLVQSPRPHRFIPALSHKNRTTEFFKNHSEQTHQKVFTIKTHLFRIAHPPSLKLFRNLTAHQ